MFIRILLTTLSLGFFSIQALAHDGSKVPATQKRYTVFDLEKMSLPELKAVERQVTEIIDGIRDFRRNGGRVGILVELLSRLKRFQCRETIGTAIMNISAELREEKEEDVATAIIEEALNVLMENLTSNPPKGIAEVQALRQMMLKKFDKKKSEAEELEYYFEVVTDQAVNRPEQLISIRERISELENQPDQIQLKLAEMEKTMNQRVRGQPEVVDRFMSIAWANMLYSNSRTRPDWVSLNGLPGTGKDTSAEAFADALWDEEGAYEKHMFRMPVIPRSHDEWLVLGSTTGHVGSDDISPFIQWLVEHSGGRYLMKNVAPPDKRPSYIVEENKEWKGSPLPGYWSPDKAVVFVNEFHNWAKASKDRIIKQFLEKGYVKINNPGSGVEQVYVPVILVFASNDGIGLVTSRETNGQRVGKPLTYEQMMKKWETVHNDKELIRQEILSGNGGVNSNQQSDEARGTSEEMLNRMKPEANLLLMRPLSPEVKREIARDKMNAMKKRLRKESGFFKSVDLSWDDNIIDLVVDYDEMAEENARPIDGNIRTLVEDTLMDAIRNKDIVIGQEKKKVVIRLGYQKNDNQTLNLNITHGEKGNKTTTISRLIKITTKDIPAAPLTDEQILKLAEIPNNLKKRVFGVDPIADRVGDSILDIENQRTASKDESNPVNVIVAVGPTSTGKTELAKAISSELSEDDEEGDNLVTFDFSQIQTVKDFQDQILGTRDERGQPIKSKFMKVYDRNNGKVVVAFDELANVKDRDLLTMLFDFFREGEMTTFSDGKPRKMGGVFVVVTGNAGQEEYAHVPRDVPMEQQMAAWAEISKEIHKNLEYQRSILERYFPAPLVTRWGPDNINFFAPHTYRSLRQLAQLKWEKQLQKIAATPSRRGWNIVVPSAQAYSQLIDIIIDEGFSLRYQGASIDSFVRDQLGKPLKALLLKNLVPSGSTVVLEYKNTTPNDNEDKPGSVNFNVWVDNRKEPLNVSIKRPHIEPARERDEEEQIITAFHEAGHTIVRNALHRDITKAGFISILPGVTMIDDQWIHYAGLAQHWTIKDKHFDRTHVVEIIAAMAGGDAAERLVTLGSHTAGKSNDMDRANSLARRAILELGLSEAWGLHTIPANTTVEQYVSGLSEKDKQLLHDEVKKLVDEGHELARQVLLANFSNALIPLGNRLAKQGIIESEEMQDYYKQNQLNRDFSQKLDVPAGLQVAKGRKYLRSDIELPEQVANIDAIVKKKKQDQYDSVPLPEKLPVGTNATYDSRNSSPTSPPQPSGSSCAQGLRQKAG